MSPLFRRFYPWLIEFWIASVLFVFFLVRILGSSAGQRAMSLLWPHHSP
jgi:hypothetical protein